MLARVKDLHGQAERAIQESNRTSDKDIAEDASDFASRALKLVYVIILLFYSILFAFVFCVVVLVAVLGTVLDLFCVSRSFFGHFRTNFYLILSIFTSFSHLSRSVCASMVKCTKTALIPTFSTAAP